MINMLLSSAKIEGLELKNRLVALPVFTGYALPDGRVSPLMVEHYHRLAKSGAAMVVVPNVAIMTNGRTSERSLVLDNDMQIDELRRLANVIKQHHAVACVQLNHAGRYAVTERPMLPSAMDASEIAKNVSMLKSFMESFPFVKRFGLTAHVAKMTAGWTREMTDADIEHTILMFGSAARRAIKAGFDMIELHGATGYLIAQFLSARTNRRPPPWGGSSDARMYYALRVLEEVRNRIPENVPVGFRLILDEKTDRGISTREAIEFAKKLEQSGAAYLSATVGTYQSMFIPDVAKQLARPGYLTNLTKRLRKQVTIPVIISGRMVSPKLAEKTLKREEADLIGLGRPLLADTDWIRKARRNETVIGCKNCNTCFQNVALGESVICDRWPKVVQDRIRLENRFTSRHGYRSLIVLSSISDLQIARFHMQQRVPIHADILDRMLFINTAMENRFDNAVREFVHWSNRYVRTHLKRAKIENLLVDTHGDPVDAVLEHLKDNFGFVSICHDETSEWKKTLVSKVPADVVVGRNGTHPNIKKTLIACDLSPFTLMQMRVALHVFHGRSDVDFRFVHVTAAPDTAIEKWARILSNFDMDPSIELKILPPGKESNVAEVLLDEVREGDYGSLIIGRRGGLARVRRRIFGSVSKRLLYEFPERSFAILG